MINMLKARRLLWIASILALCAGQSSTLESPSFLIKLSESDVWAVEEPNKAQQAPIYLVVSVIWEGSSLEDFNLKALAAFRQKFPELPVINFVSPAYFSRTRHHHEAIATIKKHIESKDSVGLAMQSWKSVVQKAGVTFRSNPTFWGQPVMAKGCRHDCGKEVPISAYEKDELENIFSTSIDALEGAGFKKPKSLFVSGWMASKPVLFAAAKYGIAYDFSAVPQSIVQNMLQSFPLFSWIGQTWQQVQPAFQPFRLETAHRPITEMGNSATTVDFIDGPELVTLFRSVLEQKLKNPTAGYVFHIGVHQETAMEFLPRLDYALPQFFELAAEQEVTLKSITLSDESSDAALKELEILTH